MKTIVSKMTAGQEIMLDKGPIYKIFLKHKGQLPKTMNCIFRNERNARATIQSLKPSCVTIALCKFEIRDDEYTLTHTEEYAGFAK